VIKNQIF